VRVPEAIGVTSTTGEVAQADAAEPGVTAESAPRWRVLRPRLADPRLHVAAVIISVQVLGQAVLGFDVSIAQILVTVLSAGIFEFVLVAAWKREIAWPASGMLTGNGVALLLRVPGTEHGDWWSTRGWPIFLAAGGGSLLLKYVIRVGGRPLFNPSNLGLVIVFLWFGPNRVDPQDLWWGPWSMRLGFTVALIVLGGLALAWRLKIFSTAITFWVVFAVGLAVLAARGHWMAARWHLGPVEGWEYWRIVALSPETLIFTFFMVTDPTTAARGRVARPVYAASVGALAAVLVSFQRTEFATKVSLLAALTLVCAARPLLERWLGDGRTTTDGRWWRVVGAGTRPPLRPTRAAGVAIVVACAVWAGLLRGLSATLPAVPAGPVTAASSVGGVGEDHRPITISPELATVAGSFGPADARVMVQDLERTLRVEEQAIRSGDATVARGAVFDREAVWLQAQIAAGDPTVTVYRWTSFEVVLLRDPVNPQSVPQLGLRATGSGTPMQMLADGAEVAVGGETPVTEVFLMTSIDGRYAVGRRVAPDDPMVVGG
jgi:hypothetical protein